MFVGEELVNIEGHLKLTVESHSQIMKYQHIGGPRSSSSDAFD